MEASPLTRQPQPEVFQPKIVLLYDSLFKYDDTTERTEGFWREFFLLRPDRNALKALLDGLSAADVLGLEERTRELFERGVEGVKGGQPMVELHALETLSVFLASVLSKKYSHPSSDVIAVLAGIDFVDTIFGEFVVALDQIIRAGKSLDLRRRAVEVVLAVTAGAYQTSLLTYFIQRDLFPAVMKLIHETEIPGQILEPYTLLGLLANYNKFEFQNPYQQRLNDFVNEPTIQKTIRCAGYACQKLRLDYVDVLEDLPEGWTFSNTLHMIGLGIVARGPKPEKKVVYDAETQKQMFAKLCVPLAVPVYGNLADEDRPGPEAALLLTTYDFTHANKLFCFNLVTLAAEKGEEQPFASYVSLTSYLLEHAHLSQRTSHYATLNLMVFRLLIEDPVLCKRICSDESKTPVRLCRQRSPYLPLVKGDRVMATAILDTMVDGISHNLRRRLDVGLYTLLVGIMLRITSYLSRSRTRLQYHWADFFRALLHLVRFLTTYASDLKDVAQIELLLDHVVNLLALSLSAGEAFLPSSAAYDDLFYKVVEAGDVLVKFKETYGLGTRGSNSIGTLVSVSAHYKEMLKGGKDKDKEAKAKGAILTSVEVADVIKQGYETLSIQAKEGLDTWERYREADERTLLKKVARVAVADGRGLVAGLGRS
ncbi:hypothetical protein ACHAQA_000102 [Verticillium albo-atrum]